MRPPKMAERLLALFYRGEAGVEVAGDLLEEFDWYARHRGESAARRWYRRQVVRSIGARLAAAWWRHERHPKGDGPMSAILTDIRYAGRLMTRRPGFTLAAIAALALGLGANAAIFSVVDAVMLRPLPYANPHDLVVLRQIDHQRDPAPARLAPATYLDWRDSARAFERTAAVRPWSFSFPALGEPKEIPAGLVSADFFQLLGAAALIGRTFDASDYETGGPRPVVLSHALWTRLFGADPTIIDRTVEAGGERLLVVGVMPPDFWWIEREQALWAPFPLSEGMRRLRVQKYVTAIARLPSGASGEAARGEARTIRQRLAEEHPRVYAESEFLVTSLEDAVLGEVRPALLLLFGAVGLVCLIAFANVAGLMLVRGVERRRELSVRAALGASPIRMARQLLVENAVLATAGAALGLLLAHGLLSTMIGLVPMDVPRLHDATVNWRAALYVFGLAAAVAFGVGLIPSLQVAVADVHHALRAPSSAGRRQSTRLRQILIAAEVAFTFVLLVGAALLGRSLLGLLNVDPGFAPRNVAMLELHVWSAYPEPPQQGLFFSRAMAEVRRLPGVVSAGAVTAPPFLGAASIEMESTATVAGDGTPIPVWLSIASASYFETMRIPVRAGRTFDERDRAGAPAVAIVTEEFARRHLPPDPIDSVIVVPHQRAPQPLTIVGVVGSVRHVGLDAAPRDEVFLPMSQAPFGSMNIVARTARAPEDLLPSIVAAVASVNPGQPIRNVTLLEDLVSATIAPRRFYLSLAAWLAVTALGLATIGLYGLISFVTAQRTREIALRIALGGRPQHVLALVLATAAMPAVVGIGLGIGGALATTHLLGAALFGVQATDPPTFAGIAVGLMAIACGAAVLPARRALRIQPVTALREEGV